MKILLVYPPFCTPTVIPYSTSYLKGFLSDNLEAEVRCLDLNAKFHRIRFAEFYDRLDSADDCSSYGALLEVFDATARPVYAENNKRIVCDEDPELLDALLSMIVHEKPDLVAFSLVYSSQCFYARALIDELKEKGVCCVAGGPAVNSKIKEHVLCLKNEVELLQYATSEFGSSIKKYDDEKYYFETIPDFSDYDEKDYLSKEKIIPIKTCSTCFYKQCTFCTHFARVPYVEYDVTIVRETIVRSGAKKFFLIDDMITKQRLLNIAEMMKPQNVHWWCQLRPTKDLLGTFDQLYASGLHAVSWGVESANQRILDLMKKGTNVQDVQEVLKQSHAAGISNSVYILFGFPSETKEEFLQTIQFLKDNEKIIDLVSTSVFGLQNGSAIANDPQAFGLVNLTKIPRTVLDERITYGVTKGMTNDEAKKMRGRYTKTLRKLNKLPKIFNVYKEQMIVGSLIVKP